MPIAVITGCWIQVTALHIFVCGHLCHHVSMINQFLVVWGFTIRTVPPWIENQFRVGVPSESCLVIRSAITIVVVHLGEILNEASLGLCISTPPIFVDLTISIVVLTIDVIFVNLAVTIIISIIDWTIVNIIVWPRSVTHSGE